MKFYVRRGAIAPDSFQVIVNSDAQGPFGAVLADNIGIQVGVDFLWHRWVGGVGKRRTSRRVVLH